MALDDPAQAKPEPTSVDSFAIMSDIHGNIENLESVWSCIAAAGLTRFPVLNGGDSVAYGNNSLECVEFLMSHPQIVSVRGNYDKHVAEYPKKDDEFRKKWRKKRPDKYRAIKDASREIDAPARAWLKNLPYEVRLSVNEHRIVLCHYVPGSKKEGLHAGTSLTLLAKVAKTVEAEIVVVGHTHSAFIKSVDGVLFVNPGSVGRSWGRPTWAVVHTRPGSPASGEIVKCP